MTGDQQSAADKPSKALMHATVTRLTGTDQRSCCGTATNKIAGDKVMRDMTIGKQLALEDTPV
jgi:hypothetical protein